MAKYLLRSAQPPKPTDQSDGPPPDMQAMYANTRLTASLTRRFGAQNLARVEDAIQLAVERALTTWIDAPPSRPEAWLYRVAHNALVDAEDRGALETATRVSASWFSRSMVHRQTSLPSSSAASEVA